MVESGLEFSGVESDSPYAEIAITPAMMAAGVTGQDYPGCHVEARNRAAVLEAAYPINV
jgi:hypothetical protein